MFGNSRLLPIRVSVTLTLIGWFVLVYQVYRVLSLRYTTHLTYDDSHFPSLKHIIRVTQFLGFDGILEIKIKPTATFIFIFTQELLKFN